MKDELQLELVEILSSIQNTAGKAGDFAMEQLPDIALSYIAYGRAWSLLSLIFALGAAIAGAWMLRMVARHVKQHEEFFDSNPAVVIPLGTAGALLVLIGTLEAKSAAVFASLVWFAPKVWLLKEMASLVK